MTCMDYLREANAFLYIYICIVRMTYLCCCFYKNRVPVNGVTFLGNIRENEKKVAYLLVQSVFNHKSNRL